MEKPRALQANGKYCSWNRYTLINIDIPSFLISDVARSSISATCQDAMLINFGLGCAVAIGSLGVWKVVNEGVEVVGKECGGTWSERGFE